MSKVRWSHNLPSGNFVSNSGAIFNFGLENVKTLVMFVCFFFMCNDSELQSSSCIVCCSLLSLWSSLKCAYHVLSWNTWCWHSIIPGSQYDYQNGKWSGSYIVLFYSTWVLKAFYWIYLIHLVTPIHTRILFYAIWELGNRNTLSF